MSTKLTKEQLKSLAHQLSHPSGEEGIAVAEQMHKSNFSMTQKSIQLLNIQSNERVLELGHGNGAHVSYLFQQVDNVHYTGLEISILMNQQATHINQELVSSNKSDFRLYDGLIIPFTDRSFNGVFTVNTIYFWEDPSLLLGEIHRVLDLRGRLVIAFIQKDFMAKLPFTQHGFELYNSQKVDELVLKNGFTKLRSEDFIEEVEVKSGGVLDRHFSVIVYQKS